MGNYDAAQELRRKRQIAEQIYTALELHAKVEEQVFYPALP